MSQILDEVLAANDAYTETFGDKAALALPPARRFAILTCMDARLAPAKFAGPSEGDAHVVRNAGIWDPFLAADEIDAQARSLTAGMRLSPHREYYFGRREFVEGNPALITALLEVLQVSGKQAMDDPKATVAFLAPKLGLSLTVMERSEARKQRYGGEPLSGQAVADQQAVADTFFKLGLIPKAIRVEDLVYHPPK